MQMKSRLYGFGREIRIVPSREKWTQKKGMKGFTKDCCIYPTVCLSTFVAERNLEIYDKL